MVYPVLVLVLALAVSVGLRLLFGSVIRALAGTDNSFGGIMPSPANEVLLILPPVLIAALLCAALAGLAWPPLRRLFRWRLPGFKEASLAMLASAMHLMLKQGGNLHEALSLARQLEQESPVGQELDQWQSRLASGHGTFQTMAGAGKTIPPLFVWLVANSGEDPAAGFRQAAELYFNRAAHKIDLLLYTALPVSILVLGFVILAQMIPFMRMITITMNALGSFE
jgi:type II secretory pathway component PulF